MASDVNLTKLVYTLTTEARDFPYTLELFGDYVDTGYPAYTSAENSGATVDPTDFVNSTIAAADWSVVN